MLDDDVCYRAMESRDRRFEGAFVIGVRTTGIYCRPGCPARMPLRGNVRFYAEPAAAQAAGLRPCLRCRPDASPGTPAWIGTPATVTRALRLIDQGALVSDSVGALADRLGVGERHLRRLFDAHLGASPTAVAVTRRAHFAKKLLEETSMTVTDVAYASGFRSLRRFHDAVRAAFAKPPRELRRAPSGSAGTSQTLTLAYRPPLGLAELLAFLRARAIPGVERVDDVSYARTIAGGTLEVRDDAARSRLCVTVRADRSTDLYGVAARVRSLFDLDADPAAIMLHLARDPALARHLRPGLRVPGAWDGFELAVRAVLVQQVSVAGATTLAGRLVARFGERVASTAELTHLFPTPAVIAEADVAAIGLPRARASAIKALARAVASGAIDLRGGRELEATLAALVALPGFGPWTASYVAMRAARDPDAFPGGDLGLRKALARGGELPSVRELALRAEPWRPWRAYAAMALWTSKRGGDR